jgi:hypothetical protein
MNEVQYSNIEMNKVPASRIPNLATACLQASDLRQKYKKEGGGPGSMSPRSVGGIQILGEDK